MICSHGQLDFLVLNMWCQNFAEALTIFQGEVLELEFPSIALSPLGRPAPSPSYSKLQPPKAVSPNCQRIPPRPPFPSTVYQPLPPQSIPVKSQEEFFSVDDLKTVTQRNDLVDMPCKLLNSGCLCGSTKSSIVLYPPDMRHRPVPKSACSK